MATGNGIFVLQQDSSVVLLHNVSMLMGANVPKAAREESAPCAHSEIE